MLHCLLNHLPGPFQTLRLAGIVKTDAENERGLGRESITAPFPTPCSSYFRLASFRHLPFILEPGKGYQVPSFEKYKCQRMRTGIPAFRRINRKRNNFINRSIRRNRLCLIIELSQRCILTPELIYWFIQLRPVVRHIPSPACVTSQGRPFHLL